MFYYTQFPPQCLLLLSHMHTNFSMQQASINHKWNVCLLAKGGLNSAFLSASLQFKNRASNFRRNACRDRPWRRCRSKCPWLCPIPGLSDAFFFIHKLKNVIPLDHSPFWSTDVQQIMIFKVQGNFEKTEPTYNKTFSELRISRRRSSTAAKCSHQAGDFNQFYRTHFMPNFYSVVRWLWLSWQSSRFQYQRSAVRIQSSATFIEPIFPVNCLYCWWRMNCTVKGSGIEDLGLILWGKFSCWFTLHWFLSSVIGAIWLNSNHCKTAVNLTYGSWHI